MSAERRRRVRIGRSGVASPPERAAPTAFLRGRSGGKRPGRQWLRPAIFRRRPAAAFASRNKIAGLRHPPLRSGPALRSGCRAGPPAAF